MTTMRNLWHWVSSWFDHPSIVKQIDQVQAVVSQACRFVPTATTVALLLGRPGLASAGAVAAAICEAIIRDDTKLGLYSTGGRLHVDGVPIYGHWVR